MIVCLGLFTAHSTKQLQSSLTTRPKGKVSRRRPWTARCGVTSLSLGDFAPPAKPLATLAPTVISAFY